MKRIALLLTASLLSSDASAQQAIAIGSWWVVDPDKDSTAAGRHTAFTQSTQGAGVIAFQCTSKRVSVVIGLNQPTFMLPAGGDIKIEYRAGTSPAREIQAAVRSSDAIEFEDGAARGIIGEVAHLPMFSFRLLLNATSDVSLVFRPIETARAIQPLANACDIRF